MIDIGPCCDKLTLVQVIIVWCRQAASHYLSQCWPRSMSPYGINRPQRVNMLRPGYAVCVYICKYIYIYLWTGSLLVQAMALCLSGTTPLPKPMLWFWTLHISEPRKSTRKCCLQNICSGWPIGVRCQWMVLVRKITVIGHVRSWR